jgi:hypothetical protein
MIWSDFQRLRGFQMTFNKNTRFQLRLKNQREEPSNGSCDITKETDNSDVETEL